VTQPPQIVDETPDYLMGLYKDKTDVQGRAASGLYVGRGLKYRGSVSNVYRLSSGYAVMSHYLTDSYTIFMRFNGKNSDDVSTYAVDHSIYALCRIDEINRFDLQLSKT